MDSLFALLSIVAIDLILAGDNSIVMALAVQRLPSRSRFRGIVCGAIAAMAVRIAATFVASRLLLVPLIQCVGGAVVLWIAVKLLRDSHTAAPSAASTTSAAKAVGIIVVADITMSLDNVLAVAGASRGNLLMMSLGLAISISLIVGASTLLSSLMGRFPAILWAGAAVLGKVGGEMLITDPLIVEKVLGPLRLAKTLGSGLVPLPGFLLLWEGLAALTVVVIAALIRRNRSRAKLSQG